MTRAELVAALQRERFGGRSCADEERFPLANPRVLEDAVRPWDNRDEWADYDQDVPFDVLWMFGHAA